VSEFTDPTRHLWWLGSRATGVAAIVLMSLSIAAGLALAGRLARFPGAPGKVRQIHEALALSSLIAIAAHGLLLLGDPFLRPGITGIALPFALESQPVWTGLGIIGGWLAAIIGLSFYVRRRIGTQVWRWLHRWTLAAYALSFAHTFGSGTDASSAWLLVLVAGSAVPILFAAIYRLLPPEPKKARERPAAASG
jgi:methionine sulfoxide reductase heme-binding subunit